MPENFILFFSFLFGIIWGSFLNVCIVRIPLRESIVHPRSFCRSCQTPIPAYHNIPILSFFVLQGRCFSCHQKISWQYPLVEFLAGVFAVLLVVKFPNLGQAALWFFTFISPLIVISFIDLKYWIIPDLISLPFIGIGFLTRIVSTHFDSPLFNFLDSLAGMFLGAGALYLISLVYQLIRKKEGIGMGDVKLAAMLGAFLGWKAILFIFLFSSFLGSLTGLVLMVFSRFRLQSEIPYGPFLSLAAVFYLFSGEKILLIYLKWIQNLIK